ESTDGRHQIGNVPAQLRTVRIDAPGHAEHACQVHDEKREVEADEDQPEGELAEGLGRHAAGHVGHPVIHRSHHRKHHAADQHVVNVSHDEVGVVHLPVERHQRHHYAGEAAQHEYHQKTCQV